LSESGVKAEEKILELLALNKEMPQNELIHETGVDQTVILRQVKKLKDENKIKVVRTERPELKEKTDKKYTLTFLGIVQVFINWNNKDVETIDVVSIAKNYQDIGLLSFKKLPVFKKAGLEYLIGEYIKKGFLHVFRNEITIQEEKFKAGFEEENLKTLIDRSILVDSVIGDKNTFFIEVCKSDPELNQFIGAELARRMEKFYSCKSATDLWESTKSL
jgi:DNA-binding Lrp family transcriptional regulator